VFESGFVTYSNAAKVSMLGIAQTTLDAHGAVSEEIAREMAEGALDRSHATLTVAVTGIAGPGGSDHKPEGRVCFGIARQGHSTHTETLEFGAIGRASVRAETVKYALALLTKTMTSKTA
jgi:nicotinamide-nucleotide amidase